MPAIIALLLVTVCGLASVSFVYASDSDRYFKCTVDTLHHADAKHCDNYKKSVACGEKYIQALKQEKAEGASHGYGDYGGKHFTHNPAERKALIERSLKEAAAALDATREEASKNKCSLD